MKKKTKIILITSKPGQSKNDFYGNLFSDYKCNCKKDNKKAGKDIYSCYVCEKPRPKLTRQQKLSEYIDYVVRKSKGMYNEKILKEALKKFNEANPK